MSQGRQICGSWLCGCFISALAMDWVAAASFTDGVYISHFRSRKLVSLGSVDEVIAGRGVPACKAWADLEIE